MRVPFGRAPHEFWQRGNYMNSDQTEQTKIGGVTLTRLVSKKAAVSAVALMTALAAVVPANATINNTVTARGEAPGGDPGDPADDITDTENETVDVEDAAPVLVLTKTVTLADGVTPVPPNAPAGTNIQYQFAVENTGNVTATAVDITEVAFDGAPTIDPTDATVTNDFIDSSTPARTAETTNDSSDATAGDGVFDVLAPGDTITFTANYTITTTDISNQGGGDGSLDNTAEATGTAADPAGPPGTTQTVTSNQSSAAVDLENANASLQVTKLADDDTNVTVGQTITYTYEVTNNGNVPITDVSLSDNVTAGTGGNPVPTLQSLTNTSGNSSDDSADNDVDVLAPGDSATFTCTYVVTQDDIDNLQ